MNLLPIIPWMVDSRHNYDTDLSCRVWSTSQRSVTLLSLMTASTRGTLSSSTVQYSTVQYSTVQYQYRHNEGGDCLLSTEILQHQASPGLGSWEGGQLLCHSTWPTNKYIRYLDTYNMYNMTPSSKVPLDQSRLHTAMLTSCPYYNVKLSKVVLKLPLLTYSDHKETFIPTLS